LILAFATTLLFCSVSTASSRHHHHHHRDRERVHHHQNKAGCLKHDAALKTWPRRELTRDADGCWTYYRPGLGHELPPPTDVAPAEQIEAATVETPIAPTVEIGTVAARWVPAMAFEPAEAPPRITREPHPYRQTVLAIIALVMILCMIEAIFGPKIWRGKPQ